MVDPKLFEVLGKYAGLGGICIGLVLLIFLAILKKNLPSPNQAYSIVKQLMYLTFAIGVIGIIAWVFINKQQTQSHAITGRVADTRTQMAVPDAEVILSGRPESAHSDGAGNFNLPLVGVLPQGIVHLYISKQGYKVYDRGVVMGQNIEVELIPAGQDQAGIPHEVTTPTDSTRIVVTTEKYPSDQVASGACKSFGAWATLCTPDKPAGWTIAEQHFELTGDRAGCAYAECEPLGTITEAKACYHFRMQGHDEECGHSGNTGIHYSQGILTVTWKHPAP
jgi:hypothetical protein